MGRTLVEEDDLMIEGCLTTRKNPVDRTKSSSKGQGIFRDRSSVRSRKTSRENPGRRARTPVDRTKSSSKGPGVIRRRPSVPFRKRNPKRPHVVVYNNSVSVDMLLENKTDRPFVQRVYRNLRVEGSVSNTVHANLRKIEAYACTPADTAESSFTDLVISRDGSSVRFGELDHVTIKGRVLVSKGPSVQFDQDIGEDLGVHLSTQDSAGVTVYTEKDYLHSHRNKRGVLILAPNFIDPQGDVNFAPATSISRPGYTKIKPDRFGGLRNLHVKGSLIIDTFVCLDQSIVPPIGGWYFGDRQHEWYRPPNGVIVPEKQTEFGVARAGDLVISRGNASVLIRGDGSGFMTAGFVALFYLTVSYGGPVDVDSRGRCGNGAEVARKIVIVFQ